VAVEAGEAQRHMSVVRKRDRLLTHERGEEKTEHTKPSVIDAHVCSKVFQDITVTCGAGKGPDVQFLVYPRR
jgi:hypothetical protein